MTRSIPATVPAPITIDQHFSPRFYAELCGLSESTILRWFQDMPGVLKVGSKRVELRIPYSLWLKVYAEKTR